MALALSCGGTSATTVTAGEPQTAKEKQYADAKAAGEVDGPNSKWGKWRYTGDRKDCFFVAGRKCFKTENAACQASHCKSPTRCKAVGAGPATMTCAK
ncbi:MAG: hypothetical protein H0T89_29940 [Deltaproteobacteria bacterium]|nr:hypothetical protein [Deltaproteobacteria bacterium]MDQ3298549.1 hypothetical protein [Myxococcota bacterium]